MEFGQVPVPVDLAGTGPVPRFLNSVPVGSQFVLVKVVLTIGIWIKFPFALLDPVSERYNIVHSVTWRGR